MKVGRTWRIALTYIGAVVGAGFSSGQEIWHFFGRHGLNGLQGIFISALFFCILGPVYFRFNSELGVKSYHDFLYRYFPYPVAVLIDFIYIFFLIGSISVMLAGSGTLFNEVVGLSYRTGIMTTLVFILATLYLKVEGVLTVNSYLIPVLIVITVLTVVLFLPEFSINFYFQELKGSLEGNNWFTDSVLYGSYNLSIAMAVITGIGRKEDKKTLMSGGIIGGIILLILNLLIFLGVAAAFHSPPSGEIPMLFLAAQRGKVLYIGYIVGLYFAMVSTAIGNYYALNHRLISLFNLKYAIGLLIISIMILPLTRSGFAGLVEKLYPAFGYLGFIILTGYLFTLIRYKIRGKDDK
ncbi:YkvI family membrane protein [Halothermothrix orenii]|uniref:Uncharacterized conserved membrane protein n=1 Tax=Halothermothrix orenii (strain H 168 / OCM 544 / DSM 9562) TaxID=373903 RepID=B8D1D8_HALOH|nr:hypothetical protein [Halothermothrix orenii]ACL71090.1 uncharacterized conserved membrane protein [Halothermothrix orenii H 168]